MKPLTVFIGYDPREHVAYQTAQASIMAAASCPVLIVPLVLEYLPFITRPIEQRDGRMWCPISDAPMSTQFAISRFAVRFLQREGWALFVDCDVMAVGDIAKLFALADDRYAVMTVKHNHVPKEATKMDDQIQTSYPRKNWSSVVLWNCSHAANQRLTLEALNTWPGRDLHAFKWLDDSEIGELPKEWNCLVGVASPEETAAARLLHFTLGQPGLMR